MDKQTISYPIDVLFPSSKLSSEEVYESLSVARIDLLNAICQPYAYFNSNRPDFESICTYLGMKCVEAMGGVWMWEGTGFQMHKKILDMGAGVYMFGRHIVENQIKFDPMYTVMHMERMCDKHNLTTIKCPAEGGLDLMYSHDPIPNPVFDNSKYIPALRGYYSVIGTGGAR